jgi:hypothetical protein
MYLHFVERDDLPSFPVMLDTIMRQACVPAFKEVVLKLNHIASTRHIAEINLP